MGLQHEEGFKVCGSILSLGGTVDRSKDGLLRMTRCFLGARSVIDGVEKPREPPAGAVGAGAFEAEENHRERCSKPFSGEGVTDKHSPIASARSKASRS